MFRRTPHLQSSVFMIYYVHWNCQKNMGKCVMILNKIKSLFQKNNIQTPHQKILRANKKYIAFNTQLLFLLFVFLFFLCGCIALFAENAYGLAVFFLCVCLLPVIIFLISPMYIVFTAQEITIVYLWGIKECVAWRQIHSITEHGSWILHGGGLPEYHISYPQKEKYPFFIQHNVPKTRKTKKLIKHFYYAKQKNK